MDALIHWQAMRRNWRMQCLASLILPIAPNARRCIP